MCPVVFYALEIECGQNRLRHVLMPFTLQRGSIYTAVNRVRYESRYSV